MTIPVAKIVHLHKAFMSEYGTATIGMDIVLVAGLNDAIVYQKCNNYKRFVMTILCRIKKLSV